MDIKRMLSVLLCTVMFFSLTVTAYTTDKKTADAAVPRQNASMCGDDLEWMIDDAGTLIISGTGMIDDFAFCNMEYIERVIMRDGVTAIGADAFSGCENLTRVYIPESVTSIGDWAFWGCESLIDVAIPGNVTSIGYGAFSECTALKNVMLSEGIESIGGEAFTFCNSLIDITIPGSVTNIGSDAFAECTALEKVTFSEGVESIGEFTFALCESLKSITLPCSVTSIGQHAFSEDVNLTDVYYRGDEYQWRSIAVENYNDELLNAAVHFNCEESYIDSGKCGANITWQLDKNGTFILSGTGEMNDYSVPHKIPWCQYRLDVKNVIISPYITRIGSFAFFGFDNVKSITIPEFVTSIGIAAFEECTGLTSLTIPDGVERIESSAFAGCLNITSFVIPESVTAIEEYAFSYCSSLTTVDVRADVCGISRGVFSDCCNLLSVNLPESIVYIDDIAFAECLNLRDVYYDGYAEEWDCIDIASGNDPLLNAKVHSAKAHSYGEMILRPGGGTYERECSECGYVQLLDIVQEYESGATETAVLLDDGTLLIRGKGYVTAHDWTYSDWDKIKKVIIEDGIYSICSEAFMDCSNLISVEIPESVEKINERTFNGCTKLCYITVDEKNRYYSSDEYGVLFNKDKTHLIRYPTGKVGSSYVIPDGVTLISKCAFGDAPEGYPFPEGFTGYIEPDIVRDDNVYHLLESLTIPVSVVSIDEYAFFASGYNENDYAGVANVYYNGTEEEWSAISVACGNKNLTNTKIHFHNVLEWIVGKEPTCTEDGEKHAYCPACGEDAVEKLPAGHSFGEWIKNEILSDEHSEYYERICASCGCIEDKTVFNVTVIDSGECGEGIFWLIDSEGTFVVKGEGDMTGKMWDDHRSLIKKVIIRNGITNICNGAFEFCVNLTDVTISDSVTKIGDDAFRSCESLTSVTIPNSVTVIGDYAFFMCESLKSVTIGNSVTDIGRHAFAYCGILKSVTFPDSVKTIDSEAFFMCHSLDSVVIPDSVTLISTTAFRYCRNLAFITVSEDNECYSNDEHGVLFNKNKTRLIQYPIGKKQTHYTVPDSVEEIDIYAFEYAENLKSVVMSDNVTRIEGAFGNCINLESITLPKYITSVHCSAFSDCSRLKSIVIPDSVTHIDMLAFTDCPSLTDVYYRGSEEQWEKIKIDSRNDSLMNAKIHFNFDGCIHIYGDWVKNEEKSSDTAALYDRKCYMCECTETKLEGTCGEDISWVLDNSGTLTISGNGEMTDYEYTTYAPWYNEGFTSIKRVVIEEGITTIGEFAFNGCVDISDIVIPDSVECIGVAAFSDTAYFNDKSNYEDSALYIGKHLILVDWEVSGDFYIKDGTLTIADCALRCCRNLKSVTIPDSVRNIPMGAFWLCESLESVTIGNGVKSVGMFAFKACMSLTSLTFPDSVISIKKEAVYGCDNITHIRIGTGAKHISEGAFNLNRGLTSIVVDENNEYYSNDEYGVLFNKDKTVLIKYPSDISVTEYDIPDSVVKIAEYAFYESKNLTKVTIPDSVEVISDWAFTCCENVETFFMSGNIKSIGNYAFSCCNSLKDVYYNGSNTDWEQVSIGSVANEPIMEATVHFVRPPQKKPIPVSGSKYTVNETVGVVVAKPSTSKGEDLEKFMQNIANDENNVRVIDADGVVQTSVSKLTTGYKLQLIDDNGNLENEYTIIILGDTDRNGRYSVTDVSGVQTAIAEKCAKGTVEFFEADVDGNSRLSVSDASALQLFIAKGTW